MLSVAVALRATRASHSEAATTVAGIGDPGCSTHYLPALRTTVVSNAAALLFLLPGAVLLRLPSRPGVLVVFAAPSRAANA